MQYYRSSQDRTRNNNNNEYSNLPDRGDIPIMHGDCDGKMENLNLIYFKDFK